MTVSFILFQPKGIVCPKCRATFRLRPGLCLWHRAGCRDGFDVLPECLTVQCPTCGFLQFMLPADGLHLPPVVSP